MPPSVNYAICPCTQSFTGFNARRDLINHLHIMHNQTIHQVFWEQSNVVGPLGTWYCWECNVYNVPYNSHHRAHSVKRNATDAWRRQNLYFKPNFGKDNTVYYMVDHQTDFEMDLEKTPWELWQKSAVAKSPVEGEDDDDADDEEEEESDEGQDGAGTATSRSSSRGFQRTASQSEVREDEPEMTEEMDVDVDESMAEGGDVEPKEA